MRLSELVDWVGPLRMLAGLGLVGRRQVAMLGVLTVLSVIFESFGVALLIPVLDYIQADGDVASLAAEGWMWSTLLDAAAVVGIPVNLATLLLAVFVLVVLRQATTYVRTVYLATVRWDLGQKMSVKLFGNVLAASSQYIRNFSSGSFVYLLGSQVQSANAMIYSFATMAALGVTFVAYGAVMVAVAPGAALFAMVVGMGAVLAASYYVRQARSISRRLVRVGERWTGFVTERWRAWRLLKIGNMLDREIGTADQLAGSLRNLSVGLARVTGRLELAISLIILAIILLALYGAVRYLHVPISIVTVFVLVALRVAPLLRQFASLRQSIAVQAANLTRVLDAFRDCEAARERDDGIADMPQLRRGITFRGVDFLYSGGSIPALCGVDAVIPAGRMTAIIGPSGSGKSTMIDLMLRLLSPTAGEILMDDVPIHEIRLNALRSRVALVLQDPILFDASIADNVRYFRQSATMDEIRQACRRAHATEFIEAMADGYDTVIGEGGTRLSGGQRQRLTIAQALLADPEILILDEPTSALDFESERKVQDALDALARERTVTIIVISHRPSTVARADHMIVLNAGRVVEAGPPDRLREEGGWYAAMMALPDGHAHSPAARLDQELPEQEAVS
ncbi:MAG: ABC transporter ATP-binding protein [Rhodospirillaceae bacterium]|nr:ABC transporter ATP-binding protein [Rhodospirillaceae bacterium]